MPTEYDDLLTDTPPSAVAFDDLLTDEPPKQDGFDDLLTDKPPSTDRTWGESAKDIGASLLKGFGGVVALPGQAYGLATGDMDNTSVKMGEMFSGIGQSLKSPGLTAREGAREQKIASADGLFAKAGTAIWETVKDPALLPSFAAEQAPNAIPGLGAAKVAKGIALAKGAGKTAAAAAGASAAAGTGAVQQGLDVGAQTYADLYKHLTEEKGYTPESAAENSINAARAAGASAGVISFLLQKLPGAKEMEKAMAGSKIGKNRLVAAGRGALGEYTEPFEEGLGQGASNVFKSFADPSQSLSEGVGEASGMGALGGAVMGGGIGALGSQSNDNLPTSDENQAPTNVPPVQPNDPLQLSQTEGMPTGSTPDFVEPPTIQPLSGFAATDAPLPPPSPATVPSFPPSVPPTPSPSGTTIAHADTDQRAIDAGFAIPARNAPWTVDEARAEAETRKQDPSYSVRLVQFYGENPDVRIDPVNAVVLGDHLQAQETGFEVVRARLKGMAEDAPGRAEVVKQLEDIEANYKATLDVTTKAGSSWGSEGRARQIEKGKELLESPLQAISTLEAKVGRPLTKSEKDGLTESIERGKSLSDEADALEAKATSQLNIQLAGEGLTAAKAKRKPSRAVRTSAADAILAKLGKSRPSIPSLKATRPTTKKPTRPKTQLDDQQKAEVDYEKRRTAAVKAAEQAERDAIAAEDEALADAREASVENPDSNVSKDDIQHPDDIQKAQEVRQPEIDARIKQAGERAGQEFDDSNDNDPGHPDFGKAIFMDATGLLTAGRILTTMARQAKDLAHFSKIALRKFGNWVRPHLQALWDAGKRGMKNVHEYLQGVAQAARKTSQQGGTSGDPRISKEDQDNGLMHYALLAEKGDVSFGDWQDVMRGYPSFAGALPSRGHFDVAKSAYNSFIEEFTGSSQDESAATPSEVMAGATEVNDKLVRQLVRAHVEAGETTPEGLLAKVHSDLLTLNPAQVERDTAHAIGEYGKPKLPNSDPLRKMETELKALIRITEGALADAKRGDPPKKSGLQREAPSERLRRARQGLRDYLNDHPEIQPTDPKLHQATPRSAMINRLKNRIEDLTAIVEGRGKAMPKRAGVPDDAETIRLNNRIKRLKRSVQNMQLEDDVYWAKQDAEWAKQMAKRIRKQIVSIRHQNIKAIRGDKTAYDKTKRERTIPKDLQDKIDSLRARATLAKKEAAERMLLIKMSDRNKLQKAIGGVVEVLNFIRAYWTTGELSAIFRQGRYAVASRPITGYRSIMSSFDAMQSNERMAAIENRIAKGKNFAISKQAGLAVTDPNSYDPAKMEEEFRSRLAMKTPIMSHFARAYSTFLNDLRARAFDDDVAVWEKANGKRITLDAAKMLAEQVNRATGRSSLGIFEGAGPVVNLLLFAAKFLASRAEYMTGKGFLWSGDISSLVTGKPNLSLGGRHGTAWQIGRDYGKNIASIGAIYALRLLFKEMMDDDESKKTEFDPRSSDWMKTVYGDTRTDDLAGLAQLIVFTTQMATGERKVKGKIESLTNPGYGKRDITDTMVKFARSKANPYLGKLIDWRTGRNFDDTPFTWKQTAIESAAPMTWRDIYDVAQSEKLSPIGKVALGGQAFVGVGVRTYKPRPTTAKTPKF